MFCNFCRDCCWLLSEEKKSLWFSLWLPVCVCVCVRHPLKGTKTNLLCRLPSNTPDTIFLHKSFSEEWRKVTDNDDEVHIMYICYAMLLKMENMLSMSVKSISNTTNYYCSKFGPEMRKYTTYTVVHRCLIESEQLDMIFIFYTKKNK